MRSPHNSGTSGVALSAALVAVGWATFTGCGGTGSGGGGVLVAVGGAMATGGIPDGSVGGMVGEVGGTGGVPDGQGGTPAEVVTPTGDPDPATDTEYERVLRLAIRFYGAQRSGDNGNWLLQQAASSQPSCFIADGQNGGYTGIDAGWFDAGDHIKPTVTNAYAAVVMLEAYGELPWAFDDLYSPRDPLGAGGDVHGTPNGIPDVLDEIKFGADFLAHTYLSTNSMILQVGDASDDHTYMMPCTEQDDQTVPQGGEMQGGSRTGRPSFTGMNGHIAGLASAALAAMSRHYAPFDPASAATYLGAARNIYAAARANASATDGVMPYYPNKNTVGMLCGASELYRATQEHTYLEDAAGYFPDVSQAYWPAGFDNPHEFCMESYSRAGQLAGEPNSGHGRRLNSVNSLTSVLTAGVVWDPAWDGADWAPLRYAMTVAYSAGIAAWISGHDNNRALALGQLDWVMGNNMYNRSFVCGYGNNSPQHPHHRNANWNGAARTLYGALVGGPVPGESYTDSVDDFVHNEVALDYNAGLVGLAAYGVHTERWLALNPE